MAVTVHLLPFKINYSGPAKVSTYFVPSQESTKSADISLSSSANNSPLEVVFSASFRGRALKGRRYELPDGYSGYLLKKKKEVKDDEDNTSSSIEPPQRDGSKVVNRFRTLSHWLRDQDPAPEPRVKNFIEFSIIASALHSKVLLEELKTISLTPQDNTGSGTKRKREGEDEDEETMESSQSESETKSIYEEKTPSTKKARVED